MFQAEGTTCAKTLRHPQLLWNSEKSSVAEDTWAGWNGGEMFREVFFKEHGRGWSLFKHDKPLEDCKQRSKMI